MILFYKSMHIVAVLFLWANVAYSIVRVRASRRGGVADSRAVFAEIARSDPWFTGSAWAVIIVSGWLLMGVLGMGLWDEAWLTWSLGLTGTALLIWLAQVLPLQRQLARPPAPGAAAASSGGGGGARQAAMRRWYGGVTVSLLVIPALVLLLMVVKPGP